MSREKTGKYLWIFEKTAIIYYGITKGRKRKCRKSTKKPHSQMISIIIPFFNTEESMFVECLSSIRNQTYQDIEIIVVDDGSDLLHKQILEKYKDDYRYIIKNLPHLGVSNARNYGTRISKGKYILYIDADDCIKANCLQKFLTAIEATNSDIVMAGNQIVTSDEIKQILLKEKYSNSSPSSLFKSQYLVLRNSELEKIKKHMIDQSIREYSYFDKGAYIGRGCYSRLIKADVAKKIEFPLKLSIGEDIIWHYHILNYVEQVTIIFEGLYLYRQNYASVTRAINSEIVSKRTQLVEAVYKELGETVETHNLIWQQLLSLISDYYNNIANKQRKKFELTALLTTDTWEKFKNNSKYNSIQNKLLMWMINNGMIFSFIHMKKIYLDSKNKILSKIRYYFGIVRVG